VVVLALSLVFSFQVIVFPVFSDRASALRDRIFSAAVAWRERDEALGEYRRVSRKVENRPRAETHCFSAKMNFFVRFEVLGQEFAFSQL
jgi:hypothetical protein